MLLGDGTRSSVAGEELKRVNPAEIGAFYEREMPRLVVFVTTRTGLDVHAAADVVQTAFEKALTRWPTLRNPRAWLYRVAQNEALARCEALRREVPIDLVPDRPDPLSAALDAELREEQREVMAHLRGLPPKQQQVMTWTLAGFGDAEIADVLGPVHGRGEAEPVLRQTEPRETARARRKGLAMRWRRGAGAVTAIAAIAELDARLSETWEAAAAAVGTMLDLPAGKEALLASSGPLQAEDADPRAPGGLTGRVPRQRRRRPGLRLVAGGAAVLAAAAVALAVAGVPGPGGNRADGRAVDAAYVVKRVDNALGAAGPGAIAQLTVTSTGSAATPGGMTTAEEWSYGAQWRSVTSSPSGRAGIRPGLPRRVCLHVRQLRGTDMGTPGRTGPPG